MKKGIFGFFDSLEDRIRSFLSKYPLTYAFIGSIGIILLWRGIWMLADYIDQSGWISMIVGFVVLGSTGLLVSFFVGDQIIISGIKQEKRIDEKTEEEIKKEEKSIEEIKKELELTITVKLDEISKKIQQTCDEIKITSKNKK